MIAWIDFLGKLLQFTLNKIVGHKMDLALDLKKRACEQFLALHKALVGVEAVTGEILHFLHPYVHGGETKLYAWKLRPLFKRIDEASKEFLSALYQVYDVARIYDPALGRLFWQIGHAKGMMLSAQTIHFDKPEDEKSGRSGEVLYSVNPVSFLQENALFQIKWEGDKIGSIDFSAPGTNLSKVDWEQQYQWSSATIKAGSVLAKTKDGEFVIDGMPIPQAQKALLGLEDGEVSRQSISIENPEQLHGLYEMLQVHFANILKAREALDGFIGKQFTVEDLLYVSQKLRGKNLLDAALAIPQTSAPLVQVDTVPDKLKAIFIERLGVKPEQVVPDASLINDLGADSLDAVELIIEFEKQYNLKIPDTDVEQMNTVGDIMIYLDKSRKQ